MKKTKNDAHPLNVKIGFVLASLGLLTAVTSLALYFLPRPERFRIVHLVVLGLWLVVPPIWFVIEAQRLVKDRQDVNFKQDQEMYSKVWAGVSAFLALLTNICK
jgi:hypothetical protein